MGRRWRFEGAGSKCEVGGTGPQARDDSGRLYRTYKTGESTVTFAKLILITGRLRIPMTTLLMQNCRGNQRTGTAILPSTTWPSVTP